MFRECLLGTNTWPFKGHSAVEESQSTLAVIRTDRPVLLRINY